MDTPVDDYISALSGEVQAYLTEIRSIVRSVAPDVQESISYRIPTFKLDGKVLMYMAGWHDYVSVYPLPQGDDEFIAELAEYKSGKGTARFALDAPLPAAFIRKLASLHVSRLR